MSARRIRGRRGFTLTEIMVALTLLAIGALGLAAFTASATRTNRASTNRTRAHELMTEKIEEFQSMSYAAITTGADTVDVAGVPIAREWTVSANDPVTGVKRVTLTAEWRAAGDTHEVSTTTLVGRF